MFKKNTLYSIMTSKTTKEPIILKPNGCYDLTFDENLDDRFGYKIRLRGEIDIPYKFRTERNFPKFYRMLKDSLVEVDGEKCLTLNENNQTEERSAYLMLRGFDEGESIRFQAQIKADTVCDNLSVSVEIYYGEDRTRFYYETPDYVEIIRVENSVDFRSYSFEKRLDKKVDFIMIKLCAVDYKGTTIFKLPQLVYKNENIVKAFDYEDSDTGSAWIGEGFSRTERQHFSVAVNGQIIFDGIKHEGLHRLSGAEFIIPHGVLLPENNFVSISYGNDNTVNYRIYETQIIAIPKDFEIMGVSAYQSVGIPFGILVHNPYLEDIKIECGENFKLLDIYKGLNDKTVIKLLPIKTAVNATVLLSLNGVRREAVIKVIADKKDDKIITGTGDFVYLRQDLNEFYEYLSWYLNNEVGRLMTFRTVYHWGRNIRCDEEFWREACKLLCEVGIYYSVMIDGRELNGLNANPTYAMLESEYFLGEQTHERDGAFNYWDQMLDVTDEKLRHIVSRKLERNGDFWKFSPVYTKDKQPRMFIAEDGYLNVKHAYETFENNIKSTAMHGATRHTGVTPFFKAFYNAGYSWAGLESMYGNHELLLGAVRGITEEERKTSFGTHLALQWSTIPTDDRAHAIRYKLSLLLSYMHGVTEINTEEGLWNIENPFEGFDRFSLACRMHLDEQSSLQKYIATHERRGKQVRRVAMIIGKYDGMACFSMPYVYGQKKEEWKVAAPEKSWDLVKVFYPQADINAIYYYVREGGEKNMPQKHKDLLVERPGLYRGVKNYESLGFYTETPYGVIDLISAESESMRNYELLFFSGWNTCTEKQVELLLDYVKNGGKLVLSKSHLYDSVDRKEVFEGKAKIIDCDALFPLLEYQKTGSVIYFNKDGYPYNYQDEYANVLRSCAEKAKTPYISGVHNISYTEYELDDKSTVFYLLNINWWDKTVSFVDIFLNKNVYRVKIRDNELHVLVVSTDGKTAVYQEDLETEIVRVTEKEIVARGFGQAKYAVYTKGMVREIDCVIDGQKTISI